MGKKKIVKKTKELSVTIGESASSSIIGEQITPRKRGRPRKIVETIEEEKVKGLKEESQDEEHESKKLKPTEEHDSKSNEELVKSQSKSSTTSTIHRDQPRRSRRKSKPLKSI